MLSSGQVSPLSEHLISRAITSEMNNFSLKATTDPIRLSSLMEPVLLQAAVLI